MKVILVLFVLAIVPALCQASENDNAPSLQKPTLAERRKARRERWAKMTEAERAAEIAKRKADAAARKAADRKAVIDRIKAAKAACPDCWRVVQDEGGKFVGLNKEQFEKWCETHPLASGMRVEARKKGVKSAGPVVQQPAARPAGRLRRKGRR